MTSQIFITESEGFSPLALDRLRRLGDVRVEDCDRVTLLSGVIDTDVLWIRLRHRIDREVLDAAPQLKFIVTPTTGLNHIDLELCEERGIRVLSLRGEVDFLKDVRATAELTVGLMLSIMRHIPQAVAHAAGGGWNRDAFKGRELCGKTVGLVGYGRLGRLVARYLAAFDCRLLVTDPFVVPKDVASPARWVEQADLLAKSDIVSLHVNLCDETESFFGRDQFNRMRSGAWFINTARGELIDEAALEDSLRDGRLAGAALDVLCDERSTGMSDHRLVRYAQEHDNLILTPHMGGCTVESMTKTEEFMAEKFAAAWRDSQASQVIYDSV